jgi:hypothetical protein
MHAQSTSTDALKNTTFDLSCRRDEIAYVKYVANAMYTEPTIVACCRCMRNGCLSNDISISETGKSLTPQFAAAINHHMKKFASDAINDMEAYGWVSYNRETTRVRRELSQSCGGVRRESDLLDEFCG